MNKIKLMNDKRGLGLGDLYPAVLTIVLIGIIVGIGIFILTETSDAVSNTEITVTNETGINATQGVAVSHASDCGFSDFAVVEANNGSEIGAGNYTIDADLGTITNASAEFQDSLWNVTYTYKGTTDTSTTSYCGVMETTETGIGGFATWIAVIVVVLAAAIVLGIVLSSFGRGSSV